MEKIFRYMDARRYPRGHIVYKAGVSDVDGVYFIKSGDFEISCANGD